MKRYLLLLLFLTALPAKSIGSMEADCFDCFEGDLPCYQGPLCDCFVGFCGDRRSYIVSTYPYLADGCHGLEEKCKNSAMTMLVDFL